VAITRIGTCTKESTIQLIGSAEDQTTGAALPLGFSHFR
jgi:hypothetical protein